MAKSLNSRVFSDRTEFKRARNFTGDPWKVSRTFLINFGYGVKEKEIIIELSNSDIGRGGKGRFFFRGPWGSFRGVDKVDQIVMNSMARYILYGYTIKCHQIIVCQEGLGASARPKWGGN